MGLIDSKMAPHPEAPGESEDPTLPGEGAGEVEPAGHEPQEGGDSESDPAYQEAIKQAHTALYQKGAAEDLARSLSSSDDPTSAMADAAYEIVSMIDEGNNGAIPDELLVSFATEVLTEVAEVAEAAGVQVDGTTVSGALKQMLQRYLTDNGLDQSEVAQQLGQMDPAQVGASLQQQGA